MLPSAEYTCLLDMYMNASNCHTAVRSGRRTGSCGGGNARDACALQISLRVKPRVKECSDDCGIRNNKILGEISDRTTDMLHSASALVYSVSTCDSLLSIIVNYVSVLHVSNRIVPMLCCWRRCLSFFLSTPNTKERICISSIETEEA